MNKLTFLLTICLLLFSCGSEKKNESEANQAEPITETNQIQQTVASSKKLFGIESAHIKFINKVGDQELIREWWFDQHGQRQYEENFMVIMGEKSGSKSLYIQGYQYQWDIDSDAGNKIKFAQTATDYQNISQNEIERYGIKVLGQEKFLGKDCLKVSMESPAKSTIWVWNNIPLKTESVFGRMNVLIEATEIVVGKIDGSKFEIPSHISFSDI
ncbi:MAG: hypothetical protein EOM23_01665 [Candidatus Moranbacteria bacterium]|nr:hypothetical protein [Candidatus Moranbacteria bacterium]